VATMPSGLLILNADLTIRLRNERLLAIMGYPEDIGRPGSGLGDLFRFEAASGRLGGETAEEAETRLAEGLRAGRPLVAERLLPDGSAILIQGNRQPDGGFALTFTDITELKRSRDALRRAKEQAEGALEELKQTQQSLIQAEKMASLGQLVAGVAHEVNTPVGITLTAASQLQLEVDGIEKMHASGAMKRARFEEFLRMSRDLAALILANSERAADLIQSFKMVAVDQSSGERRRFELKEYIEELLRSLGPTLKNTACRIVVDCPEPVEVDNYPGTLSQILTNLVMNALMHAFEGWPSGVITITVHRAGDAEVMLDFADNGRGIPPEVLPKIFDPFYTTKRGAGGSGLGLHIVFNLVTTMLKGSITVSSEPGEGACFHLRFPRIAPATAPLR
ncbi:MAG TPA: ATP-binding protein, partial [Azospirillaceae bacterium]|nr:ATP-binding protein [Azospirillaceae bacterium]